MRFYYIFHIVKWIDNVLVERHTMTVQRKYKYDAVTIVRKKFPISEGYFEELSDVIYK